VPESSTRAARQNRGGVLTIDDFRALDGSTMALQAGPAMRLDLTLLEVRSLGSPQTEGREPFALLFRGPVDPLLPQAIYRIAADALGEHDIFIVPVARTRVGTDYEAIFT
jgi:hypothetical protein